MFSGQSYATRRLQILWCFWLVVYSHVGDSMRFKPFLHKYMLFVSISALTQSQQRPLERSLKHIDQITCLVDAQDVGVCMCRS